MIHLDLPVPATPEVPPQEHVKLSTELDRMAASLHGRSLSFGDVVAMTQGRAYNLLLILLAVPFLTVIPIPLLSAFMGAVMMVIGTRLALGQEPWLPKRILERPLGPGVAVKILQAGAALLRRLEKLLRPRLEIFQRGAVFQRSAGALIAISGFLLALPLPVPFSNFLPALTVLLLAAGALERDGLFFLAGCALFVITLAFFAAIALGGVEALSWIRDWLPDWGNDPDAVLLEELPAK